MKLKTVSACAILVLLVGCQQKLKMKRHSQQPRQMYVIHKEICQVGGTNSMLPQTLKRQCTFVLNKMETLASFKQILSVHAQIVSGVNYAIEFELNDGSVWNTVVYRNLDGEYAITQSPKEGRFCEQ